MTNNLVGLFYIEFADEADRAVFIEWLRNNTIHKFIAVQGVENAEMSEVVSLTEEDGLKFVTNFPLGA